ncbi:hypothetical protein FB475_0509 [Kribbella jejuensis]|uniref:Uncharacterized protein n=1 Tax=Kribbella jejuensis TaxID=236068 RepID=A0A542EM46_9ACTN|nr:hypothetical protein FB475_0509 [Kribbella jejuensis]
MGKTREEGDGVKVALASSDQGERAGGNCPGAIVQAVGADSAAVEQQTGLHSAQVPADRAALSAGCRRPGTVQASVPTAEASDAGDRQWPAAAELDAMRPVQSGRPQRETVRAVRGGKPSGAVRCRDVFGGTKRLGKC